MGATAEVGLALGELPLVVSVLGCRVSDDLIDLDVAKAFDDAELLFHDASRISS
jgi:hypothetical protein